MTEREDNVYRAKLAEQAERYDGKAARMEIFARVVEGGGVGGTSAAGWVPSPPLPR